MASHCFNNRLVSLIVVTVMSLLISPVHVSGYFTISNYHLSIENQLPAKAILDAYCWSKIDDLGIHHIPVGGIFKWSFTTSPFWRIHYWCNVRWKVNGKVQGYVTDFVAFADNMEFVDGQCGGRHCSWKATPGGLYLFYIPFDGYVLKYPWQNKTQSVFG